MAARGRTSFFFLLVLLVAAIINVNATTSSNKYTPQKYSSMKDAQQCISSIEYALDGFIAWPGSQLYNNSIAIDNGSIKRSPVAVIFPATAEDVSIALLGRTEVNPFYH